MESCIASAHQGLLPEPIDSIAQTDFGEERQLFSLLFVPMVVQ